MSNWTKSGHLNWDGQSVFPRNLEFRPSILLFGSTLGWDCTQGFPVPSRGCSREREESPKLGQGTYNWWAMGSHWTHRHRRGRCQPGTLPIPLLSEEAPPCRHPFLFLFLIYTHPLGFGKLYYLPLPHMQLINLGSPSVLESAETWALLVLMLSNKIVFRIFFVDKAILLFLSGPFSYSDSGPWRRLRTASHHLSFREG